MLDEVVMALAAAGGSAVVQAAGTDAWEGLRSRLARWFSRGDRTREQGELERLDRSAAELEAADTDAADQVRTRQEAVWTTRIETLLENLDEHQLAEAAAELQQLLEQAAPLTLRGSGLVTGNTFHGPVAVQVGNQHWQAIASGERAVAIGGDVQGGTIVTGDRTARPDDD